MAASTAAGLVELGENGGNRVMLVLVIPALPSKGSFAMATLEMGGLIVLGIIALDVGLGYALARWDIDI